MHARPHLSCRVSIESDGEEPVLHRLHGLDLLYVVALLDSAAVAGGLAEHPVQGHRGVSRPRGGYGRRDEIQQRGLILFSAGLRSLGPPTEQNIYQIQMEWTTLFRSLPRQWRFFAEVELG